MFNNKIRKALGMKPVSETKTDRNGKTTVTDYFPDFSVKEVAEYREIDGERVKDGSHVVYDEKGTALSVEHYDSGKITDSTEYDSDGGKKVSKFSRGKLSEVTEHRADGSKIINDYSDGYVFKTRVGADGQTISASRLYDLSDKPATMVMSKGTRKRTYVKAYINGFAIGETIGLGHAADPQKAAESCRQNTLYNAALRAIREGNQGRLEEITNQALKQKQLLGNEDFQKLVQQCYEATHAEVAATDISKFQAAFHQKLEESGYQKLMPAAKANSSLRKMREAVGEKNETAVKTESNEKSSPTVEKPNRQMTPPAVERDTY